MHQKPQKGPQEVPSARAKRMPVYTEIEIDRPPAQFLDFAAYPTWTQGYIKSLAREDPALAPGSKLRAVTAAATASPTVLANSPDEFRWRGWFHGIPGLFTGEHMFVFEPSVATPGGTTFMQAEAFSGVLPALKPQGAELWKSIEKDFVGFNEDLKKKCEGER
ncbi:Uncharacterized protein TPAR_04062 [Tolypocladium paradoxum]|uniref:Polyketide cyclase/dehydrase n=1 Tax=Tolypocladium paradoxum TaxID=94208 RepID=A0A2S4KZW9_9HYPO|nr:Uncharacterized protein TPAR_04062 [Tolypocladium paradoxum]